MRSSARRCELARAGAASAAASRCSADLGRAASAPQQRARFRRRAGLLQFISHVALAPERVSRQDATPVKRQEQVQT
jgi:hypothetical protein